jgi:hypothetical protein
MRSLLFQVDNIIDQQAEKLKAADKGADKVYMIDTCVRVMADIEFARTQALKPPPLMPPSVDITRLNRPLGKKNLNSTTVP